MFLRGTVAEFEETEGQGRPGWLYNEKMANKRGLRSVKNTMGTRNNIVEGVLKDFTLMK